MNRLTAMEMFVRIVDRGGFGAAAEGSGMSTTMVSNHLRALEARLGVRLLNRTTRRQSLTEIGASYYAQCIDILARIESADIAASEMRALPRGTLRVSAPVTLGSHLLAPALADYLARHPEVRIELILNDRVVDLVEGGFDAAFRFGQLADSGLVAHALGGLTRIICAAPAYLERHGTPTEPHQLHAHRCLLFHYLEPERDWSFAGQPGEAVCVDGQLSVNNGGALLMAALKAFGIALLPDYLAAEDLAAGRLIRLFPDREFPRAPLQLVHLPDRTMPLKLRSFIDFAVARFGAETVAPGVQSG
jgi:DNA-binding transcriptional LysR family regulator